MDAEIRQQFDRLLDLVDKASISAAKARMDNVVLATLLGQLTSRWAAKTCDRSTVLAQLGEITRLSVQDATASDPTGALAQATVKMATHLQKQLKMAFEAHLALHAEKAAKLD